MRPKSLLLLVLALGCGLVASIGISQVMERRGGGPDVETVEVLVAKEEISLGDAITPEKIKVLQMPKNLVPQDAFTSLEEVEGKRTKNKIFVDDIIRAGKLTTGEATQVPDGFRVVTIRATADRGANLLKPGDRVDVQVYVRAGAVPDVKEPTLKTFLYDVRVFAVDTKTEAAEEDTGGAAARTVSLLVTSEQSQHLTFASNIGQVQLVMRSALDRSDTGATKSIGFKEFFGEKGESPGDREAETVADAGPPKEKTGILDIIKNLGEGAAEPPKETELVATRNDYAHEMLVYEGTKTTKFLFTDPTKPPVQSIELGTPADKQRPTLAAPVQPASLPIPPAPPADPPVDPTPPAAEPAK